MSNVYNRKQDIYTINSISSQQKKLDKGVYTLNEDPMTGNLFLKRISSTFEFPYKIYDLNQGLVDRFIKYYKNSQGNLGILFNGVKGTGKTVTAKMLALNLGLPIILVNNNFKDLPEFINSIPEDVVLIFDEFEKTFGVQLGGRISSTNESILTVMDGVLSSDLRRVFLLTSNNPTISQNMVSRPSRLRYKVDFGNLSTEAVTEVVDDLLIHKELREEVINYIKSLLIITIDIIKAVVEEVNIFKESPSNFKDIINIQTMTPRYSLVLLEEDGTETSLGNEETNFPRANNEPIHRAFISQSNVFYFQAQTPKGIMTFLRWSKEDPQIMEVQLIDQFEELKDTQIYRIKIYPREIVNEDYSNLI